MNISAANKDGQWREGMTGKFKTPKKKPSAFDGVLNKEINKRKENNNDSSHS